MRAVLTYHSIDASGSAISTDEATFRQHVRWLASGRVQVTTLEALMSLPPTAEAVAITFDDAFANFAEIAWPLLRDHGFPATMFVVSDFVGSSNSWPSRTGGVPHLPLLDWGGLARLLEEGVQVGSHSRTHPDLRSLPPAALAEEVTSSASRIEAELGHRPGSFAYPYGLFDDAVVAAVGAVYPLACTTELRMLREQEDRRLVPRLDAYYFRSPDSLEAWGTARFQCRLRLRAGARRLRSTLSNLARSRLADGTNADA